MLTDSCFWKICKLAFKIIHSSTVLLPAWDTAFREAGLAVRQIPRDVVTRWNSSFDMADFIIDYRVPVDLMTNKRSLGLAMYALEEHEWDMLEQLRDVLKDATLFFSRGTRNLAMVIPAMDYIDEIFTTKMLNTQQFNPAICAAVGLVKKTLNKYYQQTDLSKLYRLAMSMYLSMLF
ncbi:hypothetical protein SCLCIDRAFT_133576 [Scleroderma citrinum Foug A]|uniref:Uncharacterized protein n=1 Tax=Scleroderma citrinum Foug A TaxID=1036808 RepID=A0A0C2Z2G8_9AGAM|nr:hypothetical protein SCLCIDRAFT_133582 [Scleroderma citrinum Foug A]KIM56048.1 hypothetical protein SCLCIDRAFT_133576 [Scleroderma citrinum Foug A]